MGGLAVQLLVGAVGGLVAALVTSFLSYRAVVRSLNHARESDRLADERRLRDERRSRIRSQIEALLKASLALGQVVRESHFVWQNETVETRNQRHLAMLKEAFPGLNDARISLMVQPAGKELVRLVDLVVFPAYDRYLMRAAMNREQPGTVPYQELEKEQQQLLDGIEHVRAEGQRVLEELERPI